MYVSTNQNHNWKLMGKYNLSKYTTNSQDPTIEIKILNSPN
jgi:hypothetical protein